jgi:predicted esterase
MTTSITPEFIHYYAPAPALDSPTLLLLHGTGGTEQDLLPLARLLPGAAVLSPRGKVLERGMPRFFRRLAEGVFDVEDLTRRTHELADFVAAAARRYGFDAGRVVAAGFSNGANIAASLLLLRPDTLAAAVLFRAMVPLEPDPLPSLPRTPVLVSNGREDPLVPSSETERLAALLDRAGAAVTIAWQPGGHVLTPADVSGATAWLAARAGALQQRRERP